MALFVPIAIDALYLAEPLAVPGPMMDFSKMPWSDGQRDYNSDEPYVSQALYRPPFDDQQHQLKPGLHLHWAMPDALTRSGSAQATEFPTLPNRWMLVRTGGNLPDRQWQVESDYLFPPGQGAVSGAITMPYPEAPTNTQPFRYMGRYYPVNADLKAATGESYFANLTATGWGEPTFAAFYPNCSSVFGFHDDEIQYAPDASLSYVLIGYYSDSSQDVYGNFVEAYLNDNPQATTEETYAAIQAAFGWQPMDNDPGYVPTQSLFVAIQTFAGGADFDRNVGASDCQVTLGNSGTEALSAFIAAGVDAEHQSIIEEQLEALQLTGQLSAMQLDVTANFLEQRHTKGFAGGDAGTVWQITAQIQGQEVADAEANQNARNVSIPENISRLQQKANALQAEYDAAMQHWQAMQRQLFADWHKYMGAAYPPGGVTESFPPIDLIRQFLSTREINEISAHRARTGVGALGLTLDDQGHLTEATVTNDQWHGVAGQTAFALNELRSAMERFNTSDDAVSTQLELLLTPTAAPRFWQPKDPVVCLSGSDAEPTSRHGQDGTLLCYVDSTYSNSNLFETENGARIVSNGLLNVVDQYLRTAAPQYLEQNEFQSQPWHPILLEWEAAWQSIRNGSNVNAADKQYASTYVTGNYELPLNAPDLSLRNGAGSVNNQVNYYLGTTVLTAYADQHLTNELEAGLYVSVMPEYFESTGLTPDPDYLQEASQIQLVLDWYQTEKLPSTADATQQAEDPAYSMLRAYAFNFDLPSLTQSLGGFNQALQQLETVPQLGIADPLGFPSNQEFAALVDAQVGDQKSYSPLPFNDFSPIRAGQLKLPRLRLVDSFGQYKDLDARTMGTSELMQWPGASAGTAVLPPRIAQPSRLNFRWLDAGTDQEEMTLTDTTSPICGWMLPNHLDASLAFYDQAGAALGYIDERGHWQPAPGSESAVYEVEKIPNPHLLQVVNYLLAQGEAFFNDFLLAVNTAQDNIDPENYATNDSLSVLIGQPVAVVRARVNLELFGAPAVNQSWPTFQQDLSRSYRSTDRFDSIKFPVRIGEYEQLNDGTVGYWRETDDGFADGVFYAPQAESNTNDQIKGHDESDFSCQLGPLFDDQYLTILLDPRGKIHATTGILPVKELELPAALYQTAVSRMEVSFLSAPVLSTSLKMAIPTSTEAGYQWSWVQRVGNQWQENRTLSPPLNEAVFEGSQQLTEGWLKLKPTTNQSENDVNEGDDDDFSSLNVQA